jgi:hypothetical protein
MTPATARPSSQKQRVLLALDGESITPDVLNSALKHCVQSTYQLDILLVNPPTAPTRLLCGLLLRLEHSGIDYRLTSTEGDLCQEVLRYLKRFLGITLVLVDRLIPLVPTLSVGMAPPQANSYRIVPI